MSLPEVIDVQTEPVCRDEAQGPVNAVAGVDPVFEGYAGRLTEDYSSTESPLSRALIP
jgi:hypothetical protein